MNITQIGKLLSFQKSYVESDSWNRNVEKIIVKVRGRKKKKLRGKGGKKREVRKSLIFGISILTNTLHFIL